LRIVELSGKQLLSRHCAQFAVTAVLKGSVKFKDCVIIFGKHFEMRVFAVLSSLALVILSSR